MPELYWMEDMLLSFKKTDACLMGGGSLVLENASMPNSMTSVVSRSTNSSTRIIRDRSSN